MFWIKFSIKIIIVVFIFLIGRTESLLQSFENDLLFIWEKNFTRILLVGDVHTTPEVAD